MSTSLMKCSVRKERKQLAEKRRRQKMNEILLQIRDLVYHKELIQMVDTENQRIEKTEILEKAVDVIRKERAKQNKCIPSSDEMYQRGFSTCLSEINSFFLNVDCSSHFRQRLLGHMTKFRNEQSGFESRLHQSAQTTYFPNSSSVRSRNLITERVKPSPDGLTCSKNKRDFNGLWRPWSL